MTDVLGYARFGAQGGDWGAFVTSRLGFAHPERLLGIHLNLLAVGRDLTPSAPKPFWRRGEAENAVDTRMRRCRALLERAAIQS